MQGSQVALQEKDGSPGLLSRSCLATNHSMGRGRGGLDLPQHIKPPHSARGLGAARSSWGKERRGFVALWCGQLARGGGGEGGMLQRVSFSSSIPLTALPSSACQKHSPGAPHQLCPLHPAGHPEWHCCQPVVLPGSTQPGLGTGGAAVLPCPPWGVLLMAAQRCGFLLQEQPEDEESPLCRALGLW